MSLEQIISANRLNDKAQPKIDNWIDKLSLVLSQIEETRIDFNDSAENDKIFNQKLNFFSNENVVKKVASSFLFKPPEVLKIGSYSLKCCTYSKNKFTIDLALVVPQSFWQSQDYRDYIYHRKRILYLSYIAKHLEANNNLVSDVNLCYLNGKNLKPNLCVQPAGKLGLYCRFCLFITLEQSKSFAYSKFQPLKCHIRLDNIDSNANSSKYNSSILEDLTLTITNHHLSSNTLEHQNVLECLVLLRIWLERRRLRTLFAHILSVYVVHLMKNRIINPNHSSFQIFKVVIEHLSLSEWDTSGLIVNLSDNQLNVDDSICQEFFNYFDVVLIDANTGHNLCYNITLDLYERLRFDAKLTLNLIEKQIDIDNLFNIEIDFFNYFDHFISIAPNSLKHTLVENKLDYLNNGSDLHQILVPRLYSLIKKASSDRVLLIQHNVDGDDDYNPFSLDIQTDTENIKNVVFGIMINSEKVTDVITKGPPANSPESIAFRKLWKEKSEIRRFQNGDICEAVFWPCNDEQSRRSILINFIKFILNTQLGLKLSTIKSTFGFLDHLLELKNIKFDDEKLSYGTGEHFFASTHQSMNLLKKYLLNLSNLSFSIVEVVGVDSVFRSTDVFPMFPMNSKPRFVKHYCNQFDTNLIEDKLKPIKSYKLIVKVEIDSKLMNDLIILQASTHLLYYELSKELRKAHNLIVSQYSDYIDIFLDGYIFRIVISFNKQLSIYRHHVKHRLIKEMNEELDEIEFQNEVLPAISSFLSSYSKENPSYSVTCRLVKRWLSIQMINIFFNDLTIDLLVAYVYFNHFNCYPTPNSYVTGFVRVIKFLSKFDFINTPLIMNFNNKLSIERIDEIKQMFKNNRSNFSIIFLVTSYDHKLSYHSRNTNTLIVSNLQKLASIYYEQLISNIESFNFSNLNDLLKNKFKNFDIIIELDTKVISNKYQSIDFPAKIVLKQTLYKEDENNVMPIVDYNPVKHYINLLQKSYGHIALFCYDEFGGRSIGVLLRPEALKSRPFKHTALEGVMLTSTSHSKNSDIICLNIEALLEDFQIIGQDLVKNVIIRSRKFVSE